MFFRGLSPPPPLPRACAPCNLTQLRRQDAITTRNPGVSARFESLCRPNTPVPTVSPAGRGGGGGVGGESDPAGGGRSPSRSRGPPQDQPQQDSGGADPGAPSSWGFLPPADGVAAEAGAGDDAAAGGGGVGASAAEVEALREENASLKKELRRARAEIKRLTRESGGSGGRQAPDGISSGGGVATSASTGALEENRNGLDGDGTIRDAQHGEEGGRKGKKSRTPRESRSRKKIDIDTARATDAVVEAAAAGGGLSSPATTPEPGLSSEVGIEEMLT